MKPTPSVPRRSNQLKPLMVYIGWSIYSQGISMLTNNDYRRAHKGSIPVLKLLGVTKRSLERGPSR